MFKDVENFKVCIAGGDGTVGWVLEAMGNEFQTDKHFPAFFRVALSPARPLLKLHIHTSATLAPSASASTVNLRNVFVYVLILVNDGVFRLISSFIASSVVFCFSFLSFTAIIFMIWFVDGSEPTNSGFAFSSFFRCCCFSVFVKVFDVTLSINWFVESWMDGDAH